jgi:membrane-associated phospholipid phosphatase
MLDRMRATRPLPSDHGAAARPNLSVYRIHALVDGILVGAGGLVSALGFLFGARLIKPRHLGMLWARLTRARVNVLDRGAVGLDSDILDVASYALTALAIGGPVVLESAILGRRKQLLEEVVVYLEAVTLTTVVDTLTKYLVQRPLPRVRALQSPKLAGKPGGYRSFESGHVSMAVGGLTVASITAAHRYGARRWPWAVTIAMGIVIAAARIGAGRHYITDALVGAFSGAVIGIVVSRFHRRRARQARSIGGRVRVVLPATTCEGGRRSW